MADLASGEQDRAGMDGRTMSRAAPAECPDSGRLADAMTPTHRMDLPRDASAPALARRSLARWYGDSLATHELIDAKLIVSELVTNAVQHGVGQIRLASELSDETLHLQVTDEGSGFEHTVQAVPFDLMTGRGLAVVDSASSTWGIREGATHVWAEIERAGAATRTQTSLS
jgi:anti-sigma regulatory factor (Ser/Thr protein kinase)